MITLIFALLCAFAVTADKLDNIYLPPTSARTSGGNGNFLTAPISKSATPSVSYLPSVRQNPSTKYGPPLTKYVPPTPKYQHPKQEYNGYAPAGGPSTRFLAEEQSADARAEILHFENENNGDGTYRYGFETDNHISQQESSQLKYSRSNEAAATVEGSYSYMGPDGIAYSVRYIADENGFQPIGDHIPTPPPIPEAIKKSLAFIAAKQAEEEQHAYSNGNGNGYNYEKNGNYNNGYESLEQRSQKSLSRQYLTPEKSGFSDRSGYNY